MLSAAGRGNKFQAGPPQLWKFGQDVLSWPQLDAVSSLIASRTAQFDGLAFYTPGVDPINTTTLTLTAARAAFDGLLEASSDWGGMKYAPMIWWFEDTYPAAAWANDTEWARIASNFANYAQAAYEDGCSLLLFDNEAYGAWSTNPFPYDWASGAGILPGHTLAQARTLVRARGEQCMDAIRAVVPNVTIVILHPTGVGSPNMYTYLSPTPLNDVSAFHELNGVFHSGFAYSAAKSGSAAKCVDGGEIYTLRGVAEFQKMLRWTKYESRLDDYAAPIATVTPFRQVAGFTLWDYDIRQEFDTQTTASAQTPAELKQNIIDAMSIAETYTILYTESAVTGDWWSAPGTYPPSGGFAGSITQAYLDAVAEAKTIGKAK